MDRNELLRLARVGAEARLRQLQQEMAEIVRQFPELRKQSGGGNGAAASARPARQMSAAGRKRIGDAARRRWAQWRAQKAKAGRQGRKA